MKKHGSSHGLAVLICTITSGLLIHIGRDYYPQLINWLEEGSRFIVELLNIDYPSKSVSILILASVLAVIWGMAFTFMHSDKVREKE
jgi:hypothetical protein